MILWTPSEERVAGTAMERFRVWVFEGDVGDLHRWSVDNAAEFWGAVWDFFGVVGERGERLSQVDGPELYQKRFLPDAKLNVAQNLLGEPSEDLAIIYRSEDGESVELTRAQLHDMVGRTQQLLVDCGVGPGDRVAAWMPNCPETVAIMLATAGLGAVFSSASPDFGPSGVLDRFGQIEPTVLFWCGDYPYNGRRHDCAGRIAEIVKGLSGLRRDVRVEPGWLDGYGAGYGGEPTPVAFRAMPFDHPWYVLYSSGTTGVPKCIVHRSGGLLLKHLVEQQLHCDVKPGDRVFYFTTTGWMMWNWLVSALASDATLVLYDGAPGWPDMNRVYDLADETKMTLLGTSAKFIDACARAGISPIATHDLGSVRTITSTGSPLVAESFDWVYENVKADVHLASISGGTDLCGCLVGGDPTSPVRRGEIQAPALGLDIDVCDDAGESLSAGVEGELVCRNAFVSMPVGFWNDPDGSAYRAAYFEQIDGVWRHGDYVSRTSSGGFVISGRSDTTLNPGGVRIGTAEIYRHVDTMDEIIESIAVGQQWDGDTRVVLFVRMADGVELDNELRERIRQRIREAASPRHVPSVIAAVGDIPRTRSGKMTEAAVRAVVEGKPVKNTNALANPEALEHFKNHPDLVR